ncbi:MAG: peptidoglycan editing factor PgeF [Chloroflexi bacterium]|nr:peptidoglycan editing factor PgeF [Chloroflexota bacterium]
MTDAGLTRTMLPLLTFGSFDDPRIAHGVTTRAGGVSVGPYASLNLGMSVGDDPGAVEENRARLAGSLGFAAEQLVTTPQVHGNAVLHVTAETAPTALQTRADILVTDRPGFLIVQRYADCVPILLWHPERDVVGVAHAGWRGTAVDVAGTAVAAVRELAGNRDGIRAAIGPSIGPCCFEVGEEVVAAFPEHPDTASIGPRGRPHVDLWEINRRQLQAAGLAEDAIEVAQVCTRCDARTFFSHRALGYPAGRFGAAIGLRAGV